MNSAISSTFSLALATNIDPCRIKIMAPPTFTLATSFSTNREGHKMVTTAISRRPNFPRHATHWKAGDDVPTTAGRLLRYKEDELRQLRDKYSTYIRNAESEDGEDFTKEDENEE
ncbi:hypothetical protein F511_15921 [Dorcoceras hygrometricum]|uniref:Uncharacterized protein n=1 Tax=Dorcoceras hygrometricum TaxID=472368 RepID=A0A2Z7BC57_9LAMI|nr:hypothetical protein F511_15921 [Dorcoceras hygrometricum]